MVQKLLALMATKVHCSSNDSLLCQKYFEPITYPKNRIIEEAGKVPKYLYYIVSGYLRIFHYNALGDEVTTHLNCPPGFLTSYTHFIAQQKSNENVECITACELLRITKEGLDAFISESLAMKDFSIYVFQQSIAYNEARSRELATLNAEQRYRNLIKDYPDILQNVPVQHIASFLGMKPESLSRIRKKIN